MRTFISALCFLLSTFCAFAQFDFSDATFMTVTTATASAAQSANFVLVSTNSVTANNHITLTPGAGNCLIATSVHFNGGGGVPGFTDNSGANVWTMIQTNTGGSAIQYVGYSTNVKAASTTITSGDPNFPYFMNVVQYSGVTKIQSSSGASGATSLSATNTATSQCAFVTTWFNNDPGTVSSIIINPGGVNGTRELYDGTVAYGIWDWLNGGAGFSSGIYTNTVSSSSANSAFDFITLQ